MAVGDLVWVRFMRIINSIHVSMEERVVWKLGIIIDNKHYEAGLYKVYVADYNIVRKYFINDLKSAQEISQTIYKTGLEGYE